MKQVIFHGSEKIIEQPIFGRGKPYNDYGKGFYCTENRELAKEWACSRESAGYANCYEIDTGGLNILDLSSDEYHILHWMALLLEYRRPVISSPIAKSGMDYLKKRWLIDLSDIDIIKGYRADDSYFSFARAFLNNQISIEQLSVAMSLGKLGEQIVIKSEEAFARLRFTSYEIADSNIYFGKRVSRDGRAREEYLRMLEESGIEGIYLRDILQRGEDFDDRSI